MNIINLKRYRSFNSKSFIGSAKGAHTRLQIALNRYDDNVEQYIFSIPEDTVSFNPSFFLGMFAKSVKKLGKDGFNKKYIFQFETQDENALKSLQGNISDGLSNALNTLADSKGRALFLNE